MGSTARGGYPLDLTGSRGGNCCQARRHGHEGRRVGDHAV